MQIVSKSFALAASSAIAVVSAAELAFEDDMGSCIITKHLSSLGLSTGCCISDDCSVAAADRATAIESVVAGLAATVADMNLTVHTKIDLLTARVVAAEASLLPQTTGAAVVAAACADVTITAFQLGFTAGQTAACGPTSGGIGFGTLFSWLTRHRSRPRSPPLSLTLPPLAPAASRQDLR
jgi:hypothetical protein